MIPIWDVEPDPAVPATASFWMPSAEDLEVEGGGIGYFHNTWVIKDVTLSQAGAVVFGEAVAVDALDRSADDDETFERLAAVLDYYNGDFTLEEQFDQDEATDFALLTSHGDLDVLDLEGLEVGVAGLSHTLAAVGCVPVASCRAHVGGRSWADRPLVQAAIDREHAEWLQPIVQRVRCGFALDENRGMFMTIDARSIRDMNALASAVLDEAERNPPPPLRLASDEIG